jgi:lipopolysaccharide export system permease protein
MAISSHRVLHRYVLSEFIRLFTLSLSSLIFIYVIILFFQKLQLFTRNQAPLYLIFEYFLYKIPEVMFEWTLPYGVLFATLLTLGTLSRHSEITAMKAGGISLYRIISPLLLFALLVSLFSFVGNEYIAPLAARRTKYLLDVKVRKEEPTSFFKNYKIWYHGDEGIFNIQLLDPKEKVLKGLTWYKLSPEFRCIQRTDAREARWVNGKWQLRNGSIRDFTEDGSIRTSRFKEMEISIRENWDSFQRVERKSEEMSYTELRTYIHKISASGYDATRYLVDLHAKAATPLLNLVMVLAGIPFALKTGRSGGLALNIGISVMIGFVCGVTFYVFLSFGKSAVLPPVISVWTPIVLFGLGGALTLMSVRQ